MPSVFENAAATGIDNADRRRRGVAIAFACVVALAAGCRKDRPAEEPAPADPATAQPGASAGATSGSEERSAAGGADSSLPCALPELPWRFPAPERLVAVGDLHGDLAAARAVLSAAALVDADGNWSGKDAVLVQTGDLLDRGDDEQALIDWLEQLTRQADEAGGRVVVLNGNHELMNAAGDLRYVTPAGLADFADAPAVMTSADANARRFAGAPAELRSRLAAFSPGGAYAKVLAGHNTAALVGDSLFVHGGVEPDWARRGIARFNGEVRCWLAGGGKPPEAAADPSGPVWSRAFSAGETDCDALDRALAEAGAARMVVGHTPQESGITSACDDKVWRIDVGLGRAYGGPIQALEIRGDTVSVIRGAR